MDQYVLVPVDGSDRAEQALEHALEHFSGAKITVLHVIDPVSLIGYADDEWVDFEGYREATERQRDRAETLLDEYRDTVESHGLTVETLLETGDPAGRILDAIEAEDVDHVVMGSRGRSGVRRVLFGSVAETVTRRSPVPVTIVR
jgi:nucleotide-binding universal stress UspA family protein